MLAGVLFEQPPDPHIHAGSASTLDFYGKHPSRRSADDFTINENSLVSEIVWWGQHAPPSSGNDDFVITFYENDRDAPGRVLSESRGKVTVTQHATIPNLTEYRILLSKGLPVETGKRYWLSIYNSSPGAAWRWNNSVVGNNFKVHSYEPFDNGWQVVDGQYVDSSFRLSSVPQSKSNILLKLTLGLFAIAALWLLLSRKRAK